eukprot:g12288.t1
MDTPDDQPLNPNQRYAPHETAMTYFSYNPNHSQQPWNGYDATPFVMSRKLPSYATRSQLRRSCCTITGKPTVVDKRNVTFNPEVRGYGIKGAQQLTWQSGQLGHSATSTTQRHGGQNSGGPAIVPVTNLFGNADRADPPFSRPLLNDPPSQPSFEEGQEGKEVVFEVVTPLQEQGRGRARAVQGHNAVGRSVGVDIPILSPQLPTAQLESTLTFPEATVNEQAVGQAGGQRVGKIARVPILAAPNNYGKQLARNDKAGDIETSDIANFALFTRVIKVPAKKARDHPLVYTAQKEEVDGLYKMSTLTWLYLQPASRMHRQFFSGPGGAIKQAAPVVADIFTKPLSPAQFANIVGSITVRLADPKLPPIVPGHDASFFSFSGFMLGQDTGRLTTDWDLA